MRRILELKSDRKRKELIIFGAGNYGKRALSYCKKKFPEADICFCDNDKDKQSSVIQKCKVYAPEAARLLYPQALFIVANRNHGEELNRQLIGMGVDEGQIYEFCTVYLDSPTLDDAWEFNKELYYLHTGKWVSKDSLNTFTEKMQYAKIYLADERKSRLTDKYLVRQYVKETIGEEFLIPLLGIYKTFEEIDFECLPESFVLKATHGCNMNHIVLDKSRMDMEQMRKDFQRWLNMDWAKVNYETHYHNIEPRIVAEKYIEEFAGKETYDYKFFCFDGKVKRIMVVKNMRQKNSSRCFYDADYHFIPCELNDGVPMPAVPFEKPECLQQMIEAAERLAAGMDQVRVDLYAPEETIYFGEMTFTSWAGLTSMNPEEEDQYMGNLWHMRRGEGR